MFCVLFPPGANVHGSPKLMGPPRQVTAVSEAGEGTAVELSLAPAVAPLAPEAPRLLDDCTIVWDTTKERCRWLWV